MDWEKKYLEALVDALHPFGDVLQIGFNAAAANKIQTYLPKSHTIIDGASAKAWAEKHLSAKVLNGPWQGTLPDLGVFDAIFFDDPRLRQSGIAVLRQQSEEGSLVLQEGKKLVASIQEQMPQIVQMRYTDRDIEHFYEIAGQFQLDKLPRFFAELRTGGQITEEQYRRVLSKYHLAEEARPIEISLPDLSFDCLSQCLAAHMRQGSRFTCYSGDPASKYEDPRFFDRIITNPGVDYQEWTIEVSPPESCSYYKAKEALIFVVEKRA